MDQRCRHQALRHLHPRTHLLLPPTRLPAVATPHQLTLRVLRRLVQRFGFLDAPLNGHHELLIYRGDMKTKLQTLLLYGRGVRSSPAPENSCCMAA